MFGRGVQKRQVRIPNTLILASYREGAARRKINEMGQDGWRCVRKQYEEGLFGLGACIILDFERPRY
jgi:hypothetical protein